MKNNRSIYSFGQGCWELYVTNTFGKPEFCLCRHWHWLEELSGRHIQWPGGSVHTAAVPGLSRGQVLPGRTSHSALWGVSQRYVHWKNGIFVKQMKKSMEHVCLIAVSDNFPVESCIFNKQIRQILLNFLQNKQAQLCLMDLIKSTEHSIHSMLSALCNQHSVNDPVYIINCKK